MARIDTAAPADVPAIDDLARLLYGDDARPYAPVRQASRTLVARSANGVTGFVIGTFSDYGINCSGQIDELVVAEEARGTGLGSKLIAACEEWLRGEGADVVFVSVLAGAEGFYGKLGFQPCVGPWFFHVLSRPDGD